MKRLLALVVVLVLVAVSGTLTSCCCTDTEMLDDLLAMVTQNVVGTWEGYIEDIDTTLVFEEDGTGSVGISDLSIDMTWKTEDGLLYVDITMMGLTEALFDGAEYSISGDTLTINVDGDDYYFYKQ